jgi:hypothetical protein
MKYIYTSCLLLATFLSFAQTEIDGIMMEKNNLCIGAVYQYSSFDHYWEGKLKRDNLNIGTVSNQSIGLMGNYGISNKLNAIFSIPYIKTEASAGTLMGQKGLQDFSLTLKYMPFEKQFKKYTVSGYILGGCSIPTTNYVADFLPLSIGLQSKTASVRLMGDVQRGKMYTTFSGTYIARSNIKIDRNSYFTTEYHYTNEVFMPDVITYNFRLGYRTKTLIADAFYDNWITQKGGFDITRNNMPFPSNTMNASRIGLYAKYTFKKLTNLSVLGGYNQVLTGRNIGQSTSFNGGLFYVLDFKKTTTKKK